MLGNLVLSVELKVKRCGTIRESYNWVVGAAFGETESVVLAAPAGCQMGESS